MSPIQQLREGILKGDWQAVCDGFEGMSGMRLEPPGHAASPGVSIPMSFVTDLKRYIDEEVAKLRAGPWPEVVHVLESQPFYPQPAAAPEPPKAAEQEVAPPPPEDPAAVRARELRDRVKSPPAEPEDEFAQFRVQPQAQAQVEDAGDGRRASRPLPVTGQKMVNNFVDDGTLAPNDAELDRKMSAKLKPHQPRPDPGTVEVACCKCGRNERVPPVFAPVQHAKDDRSSYVCNRCVRAH